ncbi:MAG: alpha/beta fold hydrolase [Elusimicrobia bacterium]|nr:alpha/beta fold hydrolase [Elusimicrobiota bacterium]
MAVFAFAMLEFFFAGGLFAADIKTSSPRTFTEGELVSLTTRDNWKLAAQFQKPLKEDILFLLLHHIGGKKEDWVPFAAFASNGGYGYLALDFRGHGESLVGPEESTVTYKSFREKGTDNEWNQMVRDVEAAVDFLDREGIQEDSVVVMGAGLGANVGLKFSALRKSIPMVVLLSSRINFKDVLTVNPMRVYGARPILFATSPEDGRGFKGTQLLVNIVRQQIGADYVSFIQPRKGIGIKMLNLKLMQQILQWVKNPVKPAELPSSPTNYSNLAVPSEEVPQ